MNGIIIYKFRFYNGFKKTIHRYCDPNNNYKIRIFFINSGYHLIHHKIPTKHKNIRPQK